MLYCHCTCLWRKVSECDDWTQPFKFCGYIPFGWHLPTRRCPRSSPSRASTGLWLSPTQSWSPDSTLSWTATTHWLLHSAATRPYRCSCHMCRHPTHIITKRKRKHHRGLRWGVTSTSKNKQKSQYTHGMPAGSWEGCSCAFPSATKGHYAKTEA